MEHSLKSLVAKPSVAREIPAFYGTRRFITVFTTAYHLSPILSHINPIHDLPNDIIKTHFNILPIYVWVFQVVPFSQAPPPKTLYAPLLSTKITEGSASSNAATKFTQNNINFVKYKRR